MAFRLACVRVLAALAGARRTAAAALTALARSRRPGHRFRILAAARASGTGADRATTDLRLSGHETLPFLVLTSCQGNGVSHPGGDQDWIERLLSLNESAIRSVAADARRGSAAMR